MGIGAARDGQGSALFDLTYKEVIGSLLVANDTTIKSHEEDWHNKIQPLILKDRISGEEIQGHKTRDGHERATVAI